MALFSEYFDFVSQSAPRPEPLRGGGQNPQSLSFVLRAITKQNQNTQKKVPTTQPNPQYSAKNNVSIHMIETFMPILSLLSIKKGLENLIASCIYVLNWSFFNVSHKLLTFLSFISILKRKICFLKYQPNLPY